MVIEPLELFPQLNGNLFEKILKIFINVVKHARLINITFRLSDRYANAEKGHGSTFLDSFVCSLGTFTD